MENYEQLKQEYRELKYGLLKAQTNYEVMREWVYTNQLGHPIKDFFIKNHLRRIAVYGMGEIGLLLCNELVRYPEIDIVYAIDRNVKRIPFNISLSKTYLPDEKVDAVVVTPEFAFEEIKKKLEQCGESHIFSIKAVILNS